MSDTVEGLRALDGDCTEAIENSRALMTLLNALMPGEGGHAATWRFGIGERDALKHLAGQATRQAFAIQDKVNALVDVAQRDIGV